MKDITITNEQKREFLNAIKAGVYHGLYDQKLLTGQQFSELMKKCRNRGEM